MTKEQCLTCGQWFEDSELDAHLSKHLKDEPESEEQVEQLPFKSPLRQGAEFDWEGGLSHSTKYSPEETLSKADMHLRASGYTVRVQGSTLKAVHEKHLTWSFTALVLSLVLVLFQLGLSQVPLLWLFFVPIIVYRWFANRGQNRIVLTVAAGQLAIEYDGSTAFRDAERLSNMLRE